MKLTSDTLKQLIKEMLTEQLGLQAVELYTKAIQSTQKNKKSRSCPTKDHIRRLLDPKVAEAGTYGEGGLQLDLLFDGFKMQYKNCGKRRLKRLRRYANRYQRILKYRQRMADKRKKVAGTDAERRRVNEACFGRDGVRLEIDGTVYRLNNALKHPKFRTTECPYNPKMTYGHWADARGALYRGKDLDYVRSMLPPDVWPSGVAPAEHHSRRPIGAQEVEVPPLRVENGVPVCPEGAQMREDPEQPGRKACYKYGAVVSREKAKAQKGTKVGSDGPTGPTNENTTYSSFPEQQKLTSTIIKQLVKEELRKALREEDTVPSTQPTGRNCVRSDPKLYRRLRRKANAACFGEGKPVIFRGVRRKKKADGTREAGWIAARRDKSWRCPTSQKHNPMRYKEWQDLRGLARVCDEQSMDAVIRDFTSAYPRTSTTHPEGFEAKPTKQFSANWEAGFRPAGWIEQNKAEMRLVIQDCQKQKHKSYPIPAEKKSSTGETEEAKVLCRDILAALAGGSFRLKSAGVPTGDEPTKVPEPETDRWPD